MKILCTQALEAVFHRILPDLPAGDVIFGTTGGLVERLKAGERADLLLVAGRALDDLARCGLVEAGSITDIAATEVGIGVREGTGALDLSSAGRLKDLLLSAGPVAYPDPAGGGASGVHFASVLERLGIAEEINRHAILVKAGGSAGDDLISRRANLAVQMISELVPVKGVGIAGTLPGEFAKTIAFAAAVVRGAERAQEGRQVIAALKSPAAGDLMRQAGLDQITL